MSLTKPDLDKISSEISLSYFSAICAKAHVACQFSYKPFDDMDIDGYIFSRELTKINGKNKFTKKGRVAFVQLKACYGKTTLSVSGNNIRYDIGKEFFESHHKDPDPFILVVLDLPKWDENNPSQIVKEWINVDESQLILKKCAYFKQLDFSFTQSSVTFNTQKDLLTPENLLSVLNSIYMLNNTRVDQNELEMLLS